MKIDTNSLVPVSRVCDYIPIVSGLAAFGELLARCIFKGVGTRNSSNDRYYDHITKKELWCLIVLLIPVIGTIIVFIYNTVTLNLEHTRKENKKQFLSMWVFKIKNLKDASKKLRADKEVVLAAVGNHGSALEFASKDLQANRDVVLAAVGNYGRALEFAKDLQANRDVVLAAVRNDGYSLCYASKDLQADPAVVREAVAQNGTAFQFASEGLRATKNEVLAAVRRCGYNIQWALGDLKADRDVVREAVEQNAMALQFVSEELRAEFTNGPL